MIRARRVKCDEHQPMCQRCIKAGRLCRGYNSREELTTFIPLSDFIPKSKTSQRLAYLALQVLILDSDGKLLHNNSVWGPQLIQIHNAVPCVNAAIIAFGSAYECLLSTHHDQDELSSLSLYTDALRKIQSDMLDPSVGADCLAMASMILACVEIINQHHINAQTHFNGAVRCISLAKEGQLINDVTFMKQIERELMIVDVEIARYRWSAPEMVLGHDTVEFHLPTKLCNNEEALSISIAVLHETYEYMRPWIELRYKPQNSTLRQEDSDRHSQVLNQLSDLYEALTEFSRNLQKHRPDTHSGNDKSLAEIHAICAQVIITRILVLVIFSPFETEYDQHLGLFRIVLKHSAASIRLHSLKRSREFSHFTPRPGVIDCLFKIVIKCRDPSTRRQALLCLRNQGREGPADGRVAEAMGRRLIELEEEYSTTLPGNVMNANDIPEIGRVHGFDIRGLKKQRARLVAIETVFIRPFLSLDVDLSLTNMDDETNWHHTVEWLTLDTWEFY